MRAVAAWTTSPRHYARWRRSSVTGSHRTPVGKLLSELRFFDEHSDMTDPQGVHAPLNTETEPCGDLCTRTLAMPADTNQNGDIFGGWLLSQMDIAGGVFASKTAKTRTVTVAIDAMNFRKPVFVGDLVSVHANLVRIGRTSITVHLEAWVLRRKELLSILVTDGNFTYVSIDDHGRPQPIKRDDAAISA